MTITTRQGTVTYQTYQGALRVYSAAQRKLYRIRVFRLPDGRFEAFPKGHPVPAGAEVA